MASDCKENDNGAKGGGDIGLKMPRGHIVMHYAAFLKFEGFVKDHDLFRAGVDHGVWLLTTISASGWRHGWPLGGRGLGCMDRVRLFPLEVGLVSGSVTSSRGAERSHVSADRGPPFRSVAERHDRSRPGFTRSWSAGLVDQRRSCREPQTPTAKALKIGHLPRRAERCADNCDGLSTPTAKGPLICRRQVRRSFAI
jgi:hypothetical protein